MRRFRLADRYWWIQQDGCDVRLVWGVVGGKQQRHDRTLASPEAAAVYLAMQIETQCERGYVESQPPPEPQVEAEVAQQADERPVARSIRFEIAPQARTDYRRYPRPARFTEVEQRDRLVIERTGETERPDDADTSKRSEETFPTIAAATEAYDEAVQTVREENDGRRQLRSSRVQLARNHLALEAQCLACEVTRYVAVGE